MVISSIRYLDKGWLIAEHTLGHSGDSRIPSMPCRHWGWLGRVKLRSAVCLSQQDVGTTCRMASPTLPNEKGQGSCSSSPLSCPSFQDFSQRVDAVLCLLLGTCFFPFLLLTSHQNQKGWSFFSQSFLTPSNLIYSTFHWSYLTCSFLWSYKVGGKVRWGG